MSRHVYDNHMVAHVWAAQSVEHGRSNNGQFYFDGPTLYSYGSHYVAGLIMPGGVALLNSSRYSVSTSRHVSMASSAARHRRIYLIPDLTDLARVLGPVATGRGEMDAPRKAGVRQYVESNIAGLSDRAAIYLLGLSGSRDPDTAEARIRAEAERKAKREAEAAKRLVESNLLARGKQWSSLDDEGVRRELRAELLNGSWNAAERMAGLQKDIRRAMAASKRKGLKRQTARLGDVLAIISEWIPNAKERAERAIRRRGVRRDIVRFRGLSKLIRAYPADYGSRTYRDLAAMAGAIRDNLPARGRLRASLESTVADASARSAEIQAAERASAVERQRRAEEERKARRSAWFNGAAVEWPSGEPETGPDGGAFLRAVRVERSADGEIIGGTLETSQRAHVPLVHAVRVFRFLKAVRDSGKPWVRNGHTIRVGHFHVDRIEPDGGLVAGCHVIRWSEVERVARGLGILDAAPSAEAVEPSHSAA